uniref:Uncharacterized protein n=1 Tax=Anguilla anguilla TaxID=7936 RepID=A0A0E9RCI6_ANGAN
MNYSVMRTILYSPVDEKRRKVFADSNGMSNTAKRITATHRYTEMCTLPTT